jgi:hypothetical protein
MVRASDPMTGPERAPVSRRPNVVLRVLLILAGKKAHRGAVHFCETGGVPPGGWEDGLGLVIGRWGTSLLATLVAPAVRAG